MSFRNCGLLAVSLSFAVGPVAAAAQATTPARTVHAEIAALDQTIVYNRFGSFDPFGMIFALRRDLSPADLIPAEGFAIDQGVAYCATQAGNEPGAGWQDAGPGNARLKDCKRPRPLVLRANQNDTLHLTVHNFLADEAPDFSDTFCEDRAPADPLRHAARDDVREGSATAVDLGFASCRNGAGVPEAGDPGDWPRTRGLSVALQGMTAVNAAGQTGAGDIPKACLGLEAIAPGDHVECYFHADQEGTFFLASTAAPSGGEGDGGSIVHGLFGAVVVEPAGSAWYRSQVSEAAFDAAWAKAGGPVHHARAGMLDYDRLALSQPAPAAIASGPDDVEIVHADLNAIIVPPAAEPFREFSVFFHDELKTFYSRNFAELGQFGQLAGVRDGFAINYGAGGMGTLLLANRKGIGPAASCVECLYEEFFLSSWANGDPALLEFYADDPSNVHHSYLNDAIVFRNFHAGPKETHVFHLHAHQWFGGNDENRGAYLDSQTVAPQQGFSYRVFHSPADQYREPAGPVGNGWWETVGSGNRNRTVGDSIFHCHLYPHFAQGMWELWRTHDVLEDGTRRLPDGQKTPGFSIDLRDAADVQMARAGSVAPDGSFVEKAEGTPVPAIVPIPGRPLPLLPTYTAATGEDAGKAPMPGYPFFVAGLPGHRPPQPPLDMAKAADGTEMNGGLGRHVVTGGARTFGVGALPPIPPAPASPRRRAAAPSSPPRWPRSAT